MTKLSFASLNAPRSHYKIFTLRLLSVLLLAAAVPFPLAHAQTFTLVHYFTGHEDGAYPMAGLTIDRAGNLYGTAMEGGDPVFCQQPGGGCGTVFKLSKHGASWIFSPLFIFSGNDTGAWPFARVVFGPDGALYGTTAGVYQAAQCPPHCGTVFRLTPRPTNCAAAFCTWTQQVLYEFDGVVGEKPRGPVSFDSHGNLYSTTSQAGTAHCGTVFQLTRSGGPWSYATLYNFLNGQDGCAPYSGVVIDGAGNLYGTATQAGLPGFNYGTVYSLSPSAGGWAETTLYQFHNLADGYSPYGGLIFDTAGNLLGTTASGGSNSYGGTTFELTRSGGDWNYSLLINLPSDGTQHSGPTDTLLEDAAGNLYGTTLSEGTHGYGNVFKLTPSNGGWTYTDLYDFTGATDGANPAGGLVMDADGNLFGTASAAGGPGKGTVFEITP